MLSVSGELALYIYSSGQPLALPCHHRYFSLELAHEVSTALLARPRSLRRPDRRSFEKPWQLAAAPQSKIVCAHHRPDAPIALFTQTKNFKSPLHVGA